VKKGVIIGIIIVVAIGIAVASVYSSDQDGEIMPTQNEGENSEEQTSTQQEGGRQLSIELEEKIGLKSP